MIDINTASVSKVIVHRIGNKAREEGYQFSPNEAQRTATLDTLLIKNYLEPMVDDAQVYQLHHESDLALNTVHHYANAVFNDKDMVILDPDISSLRFFTKKQGKQ